MKVVRFFEVGKYYQFIGHHIKFEAAKGNVGASLSVDYDIEIRNWLDRKIRKCVYVSPFKVEASFEDIYLPSLGSYWPVARCYTPYLEAGMFIEVEVM